MSGARDGGALIAASTGMNSVYVWDVESSMCRHFFRVISEDGIPQSLSHASPPPPAPPALRPIALDTKPHQDFGAIDAKAMAKLNISDLTPEQNVIRALYTSPDASYVITGGADRRIRYWDIFNPAGSYVVSGIERNKPKPKYISHIEEGKLAIIDFNSFMLGASIIEELPQAYFNSPYYAMHANDAFVQVPSAPAPASTYVNSNSSIIENRFKAAQPSVNHMDCLLDIKALELPQPMLISSSRSGDIKVCKCDRSMAQTDNSEKLSCCTRHNYLNDDKDPSTILS